MVVRVAAPAALADAVALLRAGQVVGIPTETVYGLAADAGNAEAVARIFALKGRPLDHPVIVHVADAEAALAWMAEPPAMALALMRRFWPGPLTLIVPRAPGVLDAVTGSQDTVGLRCPAHPVAAALLRAFAGPGGSGGLAAPSANRFGRISPTRAEHVQSEFGSAVPLVLDGGPCDVGIESTIVDVSRGRPVILRPGAITAEQIADCLDTAVHDPRAAVLAQPAPRVSGALVAHYAPRTPLEVLSPEALKQRLAALADQSVAIWSMSPPAMPGAASWRRAPADADEYARQLYATLREFDAGGHARILLEAPPAGPQWRGIHDRLARAAVGSGEHDAG
ncbi:MAG: L-threonylcarbamoyladenylate synthase [Pigmentiphaga sp.]